MLLRRFVPHWPLLESFTVEDHRIVMPENLHGRSCELFEACSKLQALNVRSFQSNNSGLNFLFTGLPPTLKVVDLSLGFNRLPAQVVAQLKAIAPQLEGVHIIWWENGDLMQLVARMERVHKLSITVDC